MILANSIASLAIMEFLHSAIVHKNSQECHVTCCLSPTPTAAATHILPADSPLCQFGWSAKKKTPKNKKITKQKNHFIGKFSNILYAGNTESLDVYE